MHSKSWLTWLCFAQLAVCYDPNVSNGTCYFGVGNEAADTYIPCGNAAGGIQTCCQARDVCLSSNACFNGKYFVTYLAGCTDESYSDPLCPNKGSFSDQQWVGLVRCFVSNDTGEEWGPCQEASQPNVDAGNKLCSCDSSSSTAVFTDAATLTNIASLPVSAGNDIAWYPGFGPTTSADDSTRTPGPTSVSTTGGSSSTTAVHTSNTSLSGADPTNTSRASTPTPSASLSSAAKAGIGIGAAGGAVGIGVAAAWLLWYRRRRKTQSETAAQDQIRPNSPAVWTSHDASRDHGTVMSEHNTVWGGKSELPTEANEMIPKQFPETGTSSMGKSTFSSPLSSYQPYHHSPMTGLSENGTSPAASSSGLVPRASTYDKPVYSGPVYEMPG